MIQSKGKGRSFDCITCPERTQKLRQCRSDRHDLGPADNASVFPIQIFEGGEYYGFCPAKATWPGPDSVLHKFKVLTLAATSKNLLYAGGIADQPVWFVDNLMWFLPKYEQVIFMMKCKMVLGDGKKKKSIGKVKA